MIQRGDIVTYHKEPNNPLKVISDPYSYNGLLVVTAKPMGGKGERKQGIYSVNALKECKKDKRRICK